MASQLGGASGTKLITPDDDAVRIDDLESTEPSIHQNYSDEVALAVINKLRLADDPIFMGDDKPGFVVGLLRGLLGIEESPPTDAERMDRALQIFSRNLTVERIGITYAIEIAVESKSPDLAANVANAVADEYIDLQLESENNAARKASGWLETRLPELRAQSEAAQRAVVEYKSQNNIVETGGRLVTDQRLADLATQLNAARDETIRAKGRFDQLDAATSGGADTTASASIGHDVENELLKKLREQYVDLSAQEAESSAKYGPNNPAIVSVRNQRAQIRAAMAEEIRRLRDSSKAEYASAQSREAAIKKELDAAVVQSQSASQAQVKLHELDASAKAYQDLYNTFLNTYNTSLQQQITPISAANVITRASSLIPRDYKKAYKLAAIMPVAGLALGGDFQFFPSFYYACRAGLSISSLLLDLS